MNVTKLGCAAVAVSALLAIADHCSAQGPTMGIETIVATLSSQTPGNVFEQFYPNVFDPAHPKKLTFMGTVTNASTSAPAFVDFWFDWIDPGDPLGVPKTSPVIPIDLPPGATIPFGLPGGPPALMFEIPFCPPQVSIHFQNNGPGQPVVIEGQFIHECLIPEPASATLCGLGLAWCAAAARRRRLV